MIYSITSEEINTSKEGKKQKIINKKLSDKWKIKKVLTKNTKSIQTSKIASLEK